MPYTIRAEDGKYCVYNKKTGANKGCSSSRKMARAHMRALYAAESGATMGKKEEELDELGDYEIIESHDDRTFMDKIIEAVKGVFMKEKEEDDQMMIWKEADGSYRWLARYSNNFRDVDSPPEIIASQSHKSFVEKVDSGETPMPELWLWHVPEWKLGNADWIAYDDSGFALASGVFDRDKDYMAEVLSDHRDVLVSHGMPVESVMYDPDDSSIIIQHVTREISPLPAFAAANKLTGFIVFDDSTKEADMAIPQSKKDALLKVWGINPELLDRLEAANAQDAEKAKDEGIQSKEVEEAVAEEVVEEVAKEETSETEQVTEPVVEEPVQETPENSPPSRQEIADALASILNPFIERIDAISSKVDAFSDQFSKELKEMQDTEDDRVKALILNTPTASLQSLIMNRVIGNKETVVDGRSSLAKSKPKEAEATPSAGRTGVPFLDKMLND